MLSRQVPQILYNNLGLSDRFQMDTVLQIDAKTEEILQVCDVLISTFNPKRILQRLKGENVTSKLVVIRVYIVQFLTRTSLREASVCQTRILQRPPNS
jgi:hypothetical protein